MYVFIVHLNLWQNGILRVLTLSLIKGGFLVRGRVLYTVHAWPLIVVEALCDCFVLCTGESCLVASHMPAL